MTRTENYHKAVVTLEGRELDDFEPDPDYALKRWLLLEQSTIDTVEWAVSTHDTIEQAFRENIHNEYAKDWEPRYLVDLDTGQVQPLLRTYLVSFDPYAEELRL